MIPMKGAAAAKICSTVTCASSSASQTVKTEI